jgi:hypothetical protein
LLVQSPSSSSEAVNHPTSTRRNLAVIDALAWPALSLWTVFREIGPVALGLPMLLIGIWTLFRLNAALENRRLSYRLGFLAFGVWVFFDKEFGGGPYRFTTTLLFTWAIYGVIIYAVLGVAYLILGP